MKLPNCEVALVEEIKLTGYLLDEENSKGKSVFFTRMGFDKPNFRLLREALERLACSGEVIGTELAKFGIKYRVAGPMDNPLNRRMIVLSMWIFDPGSSVPRLVTAYPY